MRDAPPDVDRSVHESDRDARAENRDDDDAAPVAVLIEERAYDRRERDRRADREVDPTGDDHEQLSEREDGDDRRLREHVAEVLARAEDRRGRDDDADQDHEDQERPGAKRQQTDPEKLVAIDRDPPRVSPLGHRLGLLLRFGHHDLLHHQTRALVGGVWTRACMGGFY